jgi:16S rRNA (cytidine1402-2'-O)-methyltransferase
MSGKLFIVGTPIGNLDDITLRAIKTLQSVNLIAAEDTRHTVHLLKHFEINKPLLSYHQFNEARRENDLITRITNGESIALVSDAGMPGISDPGERLIRACRKNGVPIEVIPGPSAVLHALVGSGFATVPFHFGGFLPVKSGQREKEITAAAERKATSIYFESPHRILKTLEACEKIMPDRHCCIARELTKKFEEFLIDTPSNVKSQLTPQKIRGEITFLIEGNH